jgi:hypothetical protein
MWVVQLSAEKTEAEAQSAFRVTQTKYPVLGSYQPLIRKKDQGERGVFYAAQVDPLARDEANQYRIMVVEPSADQALRDPCHRHRWPRSRRPFGEGPRRHRGRRTLLDGSIRPAEARGTPSPG